jgi:hypothetical protein
MKQVKQAANQPDVEACWGEAGNFSVVLVFVWPKIAAKVFRRRSGATAATAGYGFALKLQSGAVMKVSVEIDCTPLEARQFIGLPDVQPMQTAVMDKLQKQLMANIEKVSPEALMQSWFDPKIAERFQDMFVTMAVLGLGGGTRQ